MDSIGALSSYALAMQQLQLNIVKQNVEAEQQIINLLTDASQTVPVCSDKGGSVDICI